MRFVYSDGGRSKYFKAKNVNDCVVRAICNSTGKDYLQVYKTINDIAKTERIGKRKHHKSSARNGVYKSTIKKYLEDILNLDWITFSEIGNNLTKHLNEDELPTKGTFILRLSRHLTCWKDGKLLDTFDCSHEGRRKVYGYWIVSRE